MASEETGVTAPGAQEVANAGVASEAKGKGKGPAQDTHDTEMDEDDEDDTEADEVCDCAMRNSCFVLPESCAIS